MVVPASRLQRIRMGLSFLPYFSLNGMRYFLSWLKNEKIHEFDKKLRINSFVPPWPSKAHDRLLHAAFSNRRIPFQAYYAVTGNCPCHCAHCSYATRKGSELSTEQSLDFIKQVKQLGCSFLGFTGGEPLLRKDLEELICACKPELATVLFTTGHGLTTSRAQRLKKAGLDWFTVGFDSSNEQDHDRVRNFSGSFQKAVNALIIAKNAGLYTAISTVATKSKIRNGEIKKLFDFATDYDVGELRIIPYVAIGRVGGEIREMPDPKDFKKLTQFHKTMNKQKKGPVVESFSYIESGELYGCGAGYHHFFVDASGHVCPCDLTPLSFGSVKEETLQAIWNRMQDFFPRPRTYCIMKKIAPMIKEEKTLPLPLSKSEGIVPRLDNKDPWPKMYTYLKRKN